MKKHIDRDTLERANEKLLADAATATGDSQYDISRRFATPIMVAFQRAWCDEIERGASVEQMENALITALTNMFANAVVNFAENRDALLEVVALTLFDKFANVLPGALELHKKTGVTTPVLEAGTA